MADDDIELIPPQAPDVAGYLSIEDPETKDEGRRLWCLSFVCDPDSGRLLEGWESLLAKVEAYIKEGKLPVAADRGGVTAIAGGRK